MTKNNWWKYLLIMVVSVFLSGCSLLDNLLFTKSEVPEFSFSGYVRADGKPLEGATVDCGVNKVLTNEQGYYSFSKINKVVSVSVYKDGFLFGDELVFVNSLSTDVNFYGYQLFDKSGVVKNKDVVIPNVKIKAESSNGKFETISNEMGEFYLSNLAGQVKVTATKDNYNFYTQSFTIDKGDEVVITGMTDISGKIEVDSQATPSDFVLKCNDRVISISDDLTFVAQNVEPGDQLTLNSDKYYIETDQFKISSTESIVFDCQKYFDILGTISCGTKKLDNVSVYFGKNHVLSTAGEFCFSKVHGKKELTCILDGFEFESVIVSSENSNVNISATTNVTVQTNLDVGSDYSSISLKVGDRVFNRPSNTGKFELDSVKFGDKISVVSNNYHGASDVNIESKNLTIDLQRYYTSKIVAILDGQNLSDVDVFVDDVKYTTGQDGLELSNLFGSYRVTLARDGYKFTSDYTINYYQNKVNAECFKIFDITGSVKSGDITLEHASIDLDGQIIECNNGNFEINDVYGQVEIEVSANGYNSQKAIATIESNELDINLDYDVTGIILCGGNKVSGARVECSDVAVESDNNGYFELKGLTGTNTIKIEKEFYTFQDESVTSSNNLQVNTTYSINGNVSSGDGKVSGLDIILISKTYSDTILTTTTDENGNYYFENLAGNYMLSYGETTLSLKPKMYNISVGENYDFSDKGFSFGGVVTCGGLPLADVNVQIGTLKTTTDVDGKYHFPLVVQGGILTLSKTGYDFENNGKDITEEVDERTDINFVATYKVVINIKSGKTNLSGVTVSINGERKGQTNETGMLEVLGLTGTNQISLACANYKFQGTTEINEYQNLEYLATFDIDATIKTGDIKISGVICKIEDMTYSSSDMDGILSIQNVKLGDVLKFEKDGYTFDVISIEEYTESLCINGCYKVSGVVSNCGTEIGGVVVNIDGTDQSTITDEHGYFEFDGVVGEINLLLSKTGFEFDKVTVNSADPLNIMSKYSVSGVIQLATGTGVGKVDIYIGDQKVATTDDNGKFKIEGLTSAVTLKCVKYGYKFSGDFEINAPITDLQINATYTISGRVMSGDVAIANATIIASNGMSTQTKSDGTYTLEDVDSEVVLECETVNFDTPNSENISGYTSSANFDLTYTVTITIDGDFSAISVVVSGYANRSKNYSVKQIVIEKLSGENEITLSKKSYNISPTDKFNVNSKFDIELMTILVYNITGTVKTESGAPIKNARVVAGDKSVRTNASGEYTINDLVGKNNLKAVLPYWNDESNATHDASLDKTYGQIEKTGTYNITFSDYNFGLNFLNYSYDILHNSNGYQIFGSGDVVAIADIMSIKSSNKVSIVYKQDKNGIKLFENKNTGDIAAGVDPNVSMLSCFDTKTRLVKYQLIQGESNVKNGVKYTNSWDKTDITYANYQSNLTINGISGGSGVNGDNFSNYNINSTSLSSVKNLSFNSNEYTYTMVLKTDESSGAFTDYKQIMTLMCDKKDLKSFETIELTFTISQTGYLKEMKIVEKYIVETNKKASVSGAKATVTGNITYNFYINQNTTINDLDTTSPVTATNGLNTLEPSDDVSTLTTIGSRNTTPIKLDIIMVKKEELLWKD